VASVAFVAKTAAWNNQGEKRGRTEYKEIPEEEYKQRWGPCNSETSAGAAMYPV